MYYIANIQFQCSISCFIKPRPLPKCLTKELKLAIICMPYHVLTTRNHHTSDGENVIADEQSFMIVIADCHPNGDGYYQLTCYTSNTRWYTILPDGENSTLEYPV